LFEVFSQRYERGFVGCGYSKIGRRARLTSGMLAQRAARHTLARSQHTEAIQVILVVGLVAGWLAKSYKGLVSVGAFIGDWLLPQIGIHLGNCFGNRQRHHWRRFASACGSAFTRW